MSCKSQEGNLMLSVAQSAFKHLFIAEQRTTEYTSDAQL